MPFLLDFEQLLSLLTTFSSNSELKCVSRRRVFVLLKSDLPLTVY